MKLLALALLLGLFGTLSSATFTGRMALRNYQQSEYCQVSGGGDFLRVKKYPLDCSACNKNRLEQEVVFITPRQPYDGNSSNCSGHITLDEVQSSNVVHYVGEHEQRVVNVRIEFTGRPGDCPASVDPTDSGNYLCQWATITYSGVVCDAYDYSNIGGTIYVNADYEVYNCSSHDASSYGDQIRVHVEDDYAVAIDVQCSGEHPDPLANFETTILEDNCGACATCEQFEVSIETSLDYYRYYDTYHTKQLRLTNLRVVDKPYTCHSGCENWTVWEVSGDQSYGGGMHIDEEAKRTTQQWTLECNDDLESVFWKTGNHRHGGCGNIKLRADLMATKMKKYDWDWRTLTKDLDVTLSGHVEHCCEQNYDCSATATKHKDQNTRYGSASASASSDAPAASYDYDCSSALRRGTYRSCSQCCSNYPDAYGCDSGCGVHDNNNNDKHGHVSEGESTINAGAAIGITIGAVVLIGCVVLAWCYMSDKRSGQSRI